MKHSVPWAVPFVAQILQLAHNKNEIAARVHSIVDKFADRGLRSLAVAKQARMQSCHYQHDL